MIIISVENSCAASDFYANSTIQKVLKKYKLMLLFNKNALKWQS